MQTEKQGDFKKKRKIKIVLIILGVVAVLLGVIAVVLFGPRNLKMDDFKETNVVTAVMRYGLPKSFITDEDGNISLLYEDRLDFYGVTSILVFVYPGEDSVTFHFYEDDGVEVYNKIARYCSFEENLMDIFHEFSYDDLWITTCDYDGSYVRIEIN